MAEEITYKIDTDSEEFKAIEAEKADKLAANEKFYDDMASNISGVYDTAIGAARDYANTQSKLQQERTDLTIKQLEEQKEAEEKDYKREQSAAYVDYTRQSGKFGAEAEEMAARGLSGSGFSESSRIAMHNAHQVRIATAREVFKRAVLNYDNMMAEARLQNSSALAEIAFDALQAEINYSIAALKEGNAILMAKEEQNMAIESMYDGKWESLYDRLFAENEFAAEMASVTNPTENPAENPIENPLIIKGDEDPTEDPIENPLIIKDDEGEGDDVTPAAPAADLSESDKKIVGYANFLDVAVAMNKITPAQADRFFESYIAENEKEESDPPTNTEKTMTNKEKTTKGRSRK